MKSVWLVVCSSCSGGLVQCVKLKLFCLDCHEPVLWLDEKSSQKQAISVKKLNSPL